MERLKETLNNFTANWEYYLFITIALTFLLLLLGIVGKGDREEAELREHFNQGGTIEEWHYQIGVDKE